MPKPALLLCVLLFVLPHGAGADGPSFADAQKATRTAFKRLDPGRLKDLEKALRPRLPAGIVTESRPFDALVKGLLDAHGDRLAARPRALEALAPFPAARGGAAVESALRTLDKEAKDLEGRIAEVEAAYAGVFNRGYMESSDQVRGTRKLAAVLIPYYRTLLLANRSAGQAASVPLAAWARGEGFPWVETRAKGASEPRLRALCARALGSVPTEAARSLLESMLDSDRSASVRLESLAALTAWPTAEIVKGVLDALWDEAWQVRALAIAACRHARLLSAVEPMIDALKTETGRLRTDLDDALYAIVGVRMYGDASRWQQWWAENGAGIQARAKAQLESGGLAQALGKPETWPDAEAFDAGDEERKGSTSSFYGIMTESQRVLFVVDISFSMDQAATGRTKSKLDVAKRRLESALADLPDAALVGLVVYSESYAAWRSEIGELGRSRKAIARFIKSLTANGTTNIADALDKAFQMTGDDVRCREDELAIDTVFLLSDGAPNRGRISDLPALLEDVVTRNARTRLVFHTVGIGEAAGSSFLKSLSRRTGGRYVESR